MASKTEKPLNFLNQVKVLHWQILVLGSVAFFDFIKRLVR